MSASTPILQEDKQEEVLCQALGWPAQASAVEVTSQDQLETAAAQIKGIKELRKEVKDFFGPLVDAQNASLKALRGKRKEADGPLDEAEQIIKGKVGAYHQKLEDERQEQLRLQREESARLERERAAAELKAQQEAEAERQRLQAEEDERARIAAEKYEAEVAASVEAGEDASEIEAPEKAQVVETPIVEAPVIEMPVTPIAPITKAPEADGLQVKKIWKYEVYDLMALIKAVAEGREPIEALDCSKGYLNSQAKSRKSSAAEGGKHTIEGVRIYSENSVAGV